MTFSIDNPEGGLQQPPPLGKYVWEKPSGEQGLKLIFVGEYHSFGFWYTDLHPVFLADIMYSFDQGL